MPADNSPPPGLSAGQLAQIQAANAASSMKKGCLFGVVPNEWNGAASFDPRTLGPVGGTMPGLIQRFNTCKTGGMVEKFMNKLAAVGEACLANRVSNLQQASFADIGHNGHGLHGDGSFVGAVSGAPIGRGGVRPSVGGVAPGVNIALMQHNKNQHGLG